MLPSTYNFRPLTREQLERISHINDPLRRRACSYVLSHYAWHDTKFDSSYVVLGMNAAQEVHDLSHAAFYRRKMSSTKFWRSVVEDELDGDYYPFAPEIRCDRGRVERQTIRTLVEEYRQAYQDPQRAEMFHPETGERMTDEELVAEVGRHAP